MRTLSLLLAVAVVLASCGEPPSPTDTPTANPPAGIEFQEGERPVGGFAIAAGQPSEARFRALAPHVARIVSLRMPDENPYDEAALAKELGVAFTQIGVNTEGLRDPVLRERVFAMLDAAAKQERLTYIHCGSGNRVGALWALWRMERDAMPLEEALADGKRAGLTKLEPLVRSIVRAKDPAAK